MKEGKKQRKTREREKRLNKKTWLCLFLHVDESDEERGIFVCEFLASTAPTKKFEAHNAPMVRSCLISSLNPCKENLEEEERGNY